MCARTHEHCAGSLCTGKSNNNNADFIGISEVGVGGYFLKFSAGKDPFPPHVHARARPCRRHLRWLRSKRSQSVVSWARPLSFEFFQRPVAAHAFPNRGDGDVA